MCVFEIITFSHYSPSSQFQLVCDGCPDDYNSLSGPWKCEYCSYQHPDPVEDPFYQSTVKELMFFCTGILLFVSHSHHISTRTVR